MTENELETWIKKNKCQSYEKIEIHNIKYVFVTLKNNRIAIFQNITAGYFQILQTLNRDHAIKCCNMISPYYEKREENTFKGVKQKLKEDYSKATYTEFLKDVGILGKMLDEYKNYENLQNQYEKEKSSDIAYQIGESVSRYTEPYKAYFSKNGFQDIDAAQRDLEKKYHYMKEHNLSTYRSLTDQQQERVNQFLHDYGFFAFSNQQFEEGLKKLKAKESSLVRLGAGGFLLKDKVKEYKEISESFIKDMDKNIHDPEMGENFTYEMFYCELCNHEYIVSGSTAETLDSLGYKWTDIEKDHILKTALEKACKDAVNNTRL